MREYMTPIAVRCNQRVDSVLYVRSVYYTKAPTSELFLYNIVGSICYDQFAEVESDIGPVGANICCVRRDHV